MEPPWLTKGRGRGNNPRGRERSFSGSSSGSSYESSSNSPILQRYGMSLMNAKVTQSAASSSIHLDDIPENSSLYAQLQAYLSEKQSDTFASIAKEDVDDIKSFEKVSKKEMIFLLENSEIQRKEEPWKIFQRYLINGLYFPGESYKTRSYYETILINTGNVEFQHFSGYNTSENVYNFSKIIIKQIISIEDSEVGFTKEQIPCLYRNNNFWDKLMKKDPKTKSLHEQELLDLIARNIQEYCISPHKGIITDSSVRHIARKISIQDGNKEEMINNYLDEVRRNLLLNINQYEKSDTSMRSETSDDITKDTQEAQLGESAKPISEDMLKKAKDFLRELKKKDKL
ncbi:hypothetical protein H5410_022048 [Solanum commersonii]|uniref:Uncharacterized protein n=1 Tax=Solanum commersonii TaxID=4109 RepID=A0A9J5ZFM8_SOLCO|nr:hypothetical protein H5410_022048 [Solanum commersonii]